MIRCFYLALILSSCAIDTSSINNSNYKFDSTVPLDIQFHIINNLIVNNASELSFSEYGVNEYKILAGASIRPLENEIKVSLSVKAFLNSESYEFSYIIKKIYNTNELNPLAENQRKEFIVMQSLDEIIQQINMEISKIEMQSIKS
ncbi:MAG: hypothetical protein VW418_02060 [Gammaproteobacteria bacterium]